MIHAALRTGLFSHKTLYLSISRSFLLAARHGPICQTTVIKQLQFLFRFLGEFSQQLDKKLLFIFLHFNSGLMNQKLPEIVHHVGWRIVFPTTLCPPKLVQTFHFQPQLTSDDLGGHGGQPADTSWGYASFNFIGQTVWICIRKYQL